MEFLMIDPDYEAIEIGEWFTTYRCKRCGLEWTNEPDTEDHVHKCSQPLPVELFVTFEKGLVVGTFTDPAAALRLNEARKKPNPIMRRFVRVEG